MAVRSAGEQLILEQMRANLNLLSTKDFTHAADDQAKIIAKLEELKKLLTSGVGDLERCCWKSSLRSINRSRSSMPPRTEEKRQGVASGKLAEPQPKPAEAKPGDLKPTDPKPLENLKQDQQQNRKATDNIAQTVKSLGGSAPRPRGARSARLPPIDVPMAEERARLRANLPMHSFSKIRRSPRCRKPASN